VLATGVKKFFQFMTERHTPKNELFRNYILCSACLTIEPVVCWKDLSHWNFHFCLFCNCVRDCTVISRKIEVTEIVSK
jgi:hypothetical protein